MSDLFGQVTGDMDPIKKILSKVPGFSGYMERQNRRQSDKLLREVVADRFEEQWQRISAVQRDLISNQGIEFIDDMEGAAIKLRQFIDRIRRASYGYSPLFDAVKINEDELALLYQHDVELLDMVGGVQHAIDNVEASLGTEGLRAAIRNLTTVSQQCVDAYNRRDEAILGDVSGSSQ